MAYKNKKDKKEYMKEFYLRKKEHIKRKAVEWHKKNPDKIKNSKLKARYGITLEEYNKILKNQNDKCKVCQTKPSGGRSLNVDHCHKSGAIRGILCSKCNSCLGLVDDNIDILNKLIIYLKS